MPPHPNIIVILADDLGYGDVSFNGCPDFATPNIDSLTVNGIQCSNGYVTHPFCSPSRAALLTGRYQQRFGHENQPQGDSDNPRLGIPAQELLLPQILKPAGYVCGAVGKWHLGLASNFHPMQRGFDEFFGFLGGQSTYYNASLFRGTTQIIESTYLTDAFTREAVSFINRHAAQPFFLYLAYNAVHFPNDTPPKAYMDRVANIADNSRRVYAAMALALDDGVGQVLQALQAQNVLNNTLIFFLSDNGAPQATFTRNYPLRGYKYNMLEGGIHVPFAVQWPAKLPARAVFDQPVSALDIVATAAAAAGVQLPDDRVYDGLNIIPYFTGEQVSPQRTLFWRWFGLGKDGPPCDPEGASGISGGAPGTIWAVRSGQLKLVAARGALSQPPSLYNLQTDIGETQNLAVAQPENVDALKALYNQWNTQTIPPLWLNNTDTGILPLVLAGDWNGYNKGDSAIPWRLTRTTAPGIEGTPDGFNWFTTTIQVTAAGGNTTPGTHSFTFVGSNSYSEQWGGTIINIDGTTSVPFFSGSGLGPSNTISFEDGYYYSFRILDWTKQIGASMKIAVMKTSAPPVSVRLNGQAPVNPTSDDSVEVNVFTTQPKSVEERIYLRWSTDFFVTSHMVEAMGSGQNYFATIPAQVAGTGVQYCATTSTVDLSPLLTSGAIDSLALATSSVSHFVAAVSPNATPPPSNQRPVVNVGPDLTVATHSTNLSGSATDDGLPNPPGALTYKWSTVNGPGTVTFGTPGALTTAVSFSAGGVYTLQLSANDGALTGYDNLALTVNKKPTVNAGLDQTITLPSTATLSGSATDDGIPNPPGALTYTWSKVTGPGNVTFQNVHSAATSATFSISGSYTLRLGASDSVFAGSDQMLVTVNPASSATPTATPTPTITPTATPTPTPVPAAPSNLKAAASSQSGINLVWTDRSTNETGFKIERSPSGKKFTQIATVGADVSGFGDTGLTASTKYYYRVRAYNGAGNSGYSNKASATTLSAPTPTPTPSPAATP